MATNGMTVNPAELVLCSQTMLQEATQFGGTADTLSQGPAYGVGTGTIFGTLPASSRLAKLTAEVNDAANGQFTAAETFLRGTEYALDAALQAYIKADGASALMAADAAAAAIRHAEEATP